MSEWVSDTGCQCRFYDVHKNSCSVNAGFFLCLLESCGWVTIPSLLFGMLIAEGNSCNPLLEFFFCLFASCSWVTITSLLFGVLRSSMFLSCCEIIGSSFHCKQMEDTFFLLKKLSITEASFRAVCYITDKLKCRPRFIKSSLSRSISNIFTLFYIFILFFNCLLKLTTSLFTLEEEIRLYLGGAVITTIFTFCLFSTRLRKHL